MKKLAIFLALAVVLVLLPGCSGGKVSALSAQTQDLAGKSFTLVKVGDQAPQVKSKPTLGFSDDMRAYGSFCNRFMGQAELKDGVLTIERLASTMMLCPDQVSDELERNGLQMLTSGARADFDGETLTLSRDGYRLEYRLDR